jgi:two-component system NarL family response regulator
VDEPQEISILYVEDHAIVREAITQFLNLQPDIRVVAVAASGEEALDLFRRHRPDVTVMDLQLPGISGVEAIRALRAEFPEARIVVLTMYQGDEDIHRALEAGAASYLLKDSVSDDLLRVVREVHAGKQPTLPAEVSSRLAARGMNAPLTRRERDVVELIAAGMRNKEIASTLGISEETVHGYIKNVFAKHHPSAVMSPTARRPRLQMRLGR